MSNGLDFERQVHALLKKMGFDAEVTRASGDGGIDIIAHSREHITGGKYIIQCKDWSKPVGEPPVRDLYGVVTAENANKGILITTSTFTAPALKFAEGKPLELIDGTKLKQLLTKYSIAGAEDEAMPIAEDERLKELANQLGINPKNIFALKEIADIYLMQGDYNKAVEFYEKLVPLKPSVETERLKNTYQGGLINCGVALAKLKRYEDALKIFRKDMISDSLNEGHLTHYLGMYDIALSIFQRIKKLCDDSDTCDEHIEKTYMQEQPDYPHLVAFIRNDESEYTIIYLETAAQKIKQEIYMYAKFFMPPADIMKEFVENWTSLKNMIEMDQYLGRSEEDYMDEAKSINFLENKCLTVISTGNEIMNIVTTNALQESCREYVISGITSTKVIYDSILKFKKYLSDGRDSFSSVDDGNLSERYELWQQGLLECVNGSILAVHNKIKEDEALHMGFIEEEKKMTIICEGAIEKEKAEWREELLKTLYLTQTPTEGENNIPFAQYRHGEP